MVKRLLNFFFFYIKKNPKKFLKTKNTKEKKIERNISDFIAGMTDRFAINLYKELK